MRNSDDNHTNRTEERLDQYRISGEKITKKSRILNGRKKQSNVLRILREYVSIPSFSIRKRGLKKRHRLFPIVLILYLVVFVIASIVSLVSGEEAKAVSQQAMGTAAVIPEIGGEPSAVLPCPTTITTKPGDTEGEQIASSEYGDYIPGGSPRPGCQSGIWTCPIDSGGDFGDYVPVALGENGSGQKFVICLNAFNKHNTKLSPSFSAQTITDMANQEACTTKILDKTPRPVCTNVPGVAGYTWICPSGYLFHRETEGGGSHENFGNTERSKGIGCKTENENWVFPCSDFDEDLPNVTVIQKDWLSGNHPSVQSNGTVTPPGANEGGRFVNTFAADTYSLQGVVNLKPYTLGIGLLLLTPVIILVGYQVMLGSITFRYANALQAIPRLVMGIGILVVSFTMTEMLISISNMITEGIVNLHSVLGYPRALINGEPIAYTLENEGDATSYRGMVVPMSRWGCAANEFVEILAVKFIMDVLAAIIPLFGNLVHLVGTITTFFMFIEHLGEFILLVLSIMLWAQVLIRIILLNYYILLAPIAFGCWALPGGQGQNVVNLWTKGFLSTLAIQIVQVFMITTMPLVIPVLPSIPADSLGLMQGILTQLPPVIVMWMTVRAPSILGTSSAKAVTQAGSVAGGVVTAVGATAYNVV